MLIQTLPRPRTVSPAQLQVEYSGRRLYLNTVNKNNFSVKDFIFNKFFYLQAYKLTKRNRFSLFLCLRVSMLFGNLVEIEI